MPWNVEKMRSTTVIIWIVYVYQEIKYCTKYVDPEKLQVQEEVVPVFF
jgi:hypothetical protein